MRADGPGSPSAIEQSSGREAKTIHRLLEYGVGEEDEYGAGMRFIRNEENPLEAEAVVVDEASMVDIFLMRALLRALADGTRLVIVGDADQLPSVGPGNVLRDVIKSGAFPISKTDPLLPSERRRQHRGKTRIALITVRTLSFT